MHKDLRRNQTHKHKLNRHKYLHRNKTDYDETYKKIRLGVPHILYILTRLVCVCVCLVYLTPKQPSTKPGFEYII